jgi:hypothetical protein
MKTNWVVQRILNLCTSWRWVVNFTPRTFYPQGNNLRCPSDMRLGGTQSRSGHSGEDTNPLELPGTLNWKEYGVFLKYSEINLPRTHGVPWNWTWTVENWAPTAWDMAGPCCTLNMTFITQKRYLNYIHVRAWGCSLQFGDIRLEIGNFILKFEQPS